MDAPILNGLLGYIKEKNIPFHMPGHKNNLKGFKELEIIKEELFNIDLTEVEGVDNLHSPEGIIKEAQIKISSAFKSSESFILVNGSTSGIYSMILGLTKPKDKIIIQRNCHRSVYMAAFLGDLDVAYINPTILDEFNIPVSIDVNEIFKVIEENKDAKAIVLTYPTYYGTCFDLAKVVEFAHKNNMYVLVDEAHGAHFPFSKKLPKSAMECGADVSVNSFHKTLPALTQTAVLNVNKGVDVTGIKFMLKIFQTTSPSYVLMASVDAARSIMENQGEKLIDDLLANIEKFKQKLSKINCYKLLDENYIGKSSIYDIDKTRIVINSKFGGRFLDKVLRRDYNIQVEMSDLYNIVLIGTVADKVEFYEKLIYALDDIASRYQVKHFDTINFRNMKYNKAIPIKDAYYMTKKRIKLKDAVGSISGEMIVPYPPGVPILVPGEMITYEVIKAIEVFKKSGITLNGLEDSSGEYILIVNGG